MGKGTFFGGIHPWDGKELSKDKPVVRLNPKSEMVFPMLQHVGTPAKPIVAVGDAVLMGQCIGEANGVVSANIISSVSGKVKAIEPRTAASGAKVLSVVIENDGEYNAVAGFGEKRNYKALKPKEIINIVKTAGIVGMGGAGFPNHVKLAPKNPDKIDYILVNAAECEPYLTSDYRRMLEEPEKLVEGLRIVLSLFPKAQGIICIEDNKEAVVSGISELIKNDKNITIKMLQTKYPQGAERNLVYASVGRMTNFSVLPMDVGCIVQNVDTICAIYRAVAESTPLIRRIVTVTGDAVKEPQNFDVPIGTNYAELIEAAGGFTCEPKKVISGGPMMGTALYTLDVPVQKTSSAIVAFKEDEVEQYESSPCIRCGRCVEACPSHLIPTMMEKAARVFDNEAFEGLNGLECYECGSCTYVCPAGRRLTQSFKQTRRAILDARKKN